MRSVDPSTVRSSPSSRGGIRRSAVRGLVGVATALALPATAAPSEGMKVTRENMWSNPEVYVGLGTGAFTSDLGDLTDTGMSWTIRAGVQPTRNLGGEISYVGLNTGVNTIIPVSGAPIRDQNYKQNQFTANVRGGVPIAMGERDLTPYALVGIGYARLTPDNALGRIGLESDNTMAIPLGLGATYDLNDRFKVDGRFTYNALQFVNDSALVDGANSWMATVNVGASLGR